MAAEDENSMPRAPTVAAEKQYCKVSFFWAIGCLVITVIGIWIGFDGIGTLPVCRFGEPDCYFRVEICGSQGAGNDKGKCNYEMKHRAIEGSSNDADGGIIEGAEALAIPCLALALAVLPALLTVFGTALKRRIPDLLSTAKMFVGVAIAMLILGIRCIQDLTFDCRWWNDSHHGNAAVCHKGLNLYIAASVLIIVAQSMGFAISTQFVEDQYTKMYSSGDAPEIVDKCCFGRARANGRF